jgi:hypothetical protein
LSLWLIGRRVLELDKCEARIIRDYRSGDGKANQERNLQIRTTTTRISFITVGMERETREMGETKTQKV